MRLMLSPMEGSRVRLVGTSLGGRQSRRATLTRVSGGRYAAARLRVPVYSRRRTIG